MAKSGIGTFEVAVLVTTIALGSRAWVESIARMTIALILTVAIVCALHGVLFKLPDELLKLGAGLLLLSSGTFWPGEAAGLEWPGRDLSAVPFRDYMLYRVLSDSLVAGEIPIKRVSCSDAV